MFCGFFKMVTSRPIFVIVLTIRWFRVVFCIYSSTGSGIVLNLVIPDVGCSSEESEKIFISLNLTMSLTMAGSQTGPKGNKKGGIYCFVVV